MGTLDRYARGAIQEALRSIDLILDRGAGVLAHIPLVGLLPDGGHEQIADRQTLARLQYEFIHNLPEPGGAAVERVLDDLAPFDDHCLVLLALGQVRSVCQSFKADRPLYGVSLTAFERGESPKYLRYALEVYGGTYTVDTVVTLTRQKFTYVLQRGSRGPIQFFPQKGLRDVHGFRDILSYIDDDPLPIDPMSDDYSEIP